MNRNALLLIAAIAIGAAVMTRKLWMIPDKGQVYLPYFRDAEYKYGLPPQLLARVADQESDFNPAAYNARSGARGMMQIIPKWHPEVNVTDLDPIDDIYYAGRYLRENFNRFGSWAKALAAYNWGPGNLGRALDRHGANWLAHAPKETQNYVRGITGDLGIA